MRFRIFKIVATTLSVVAGITCLGVALFAYQLGLDNNVTLGTSRKILAGLGVLFLVAPPGVLLLSRLMRRVKVPDFILVFQTKWQKYQDSSTHNSPLPLSKSSVNLKPIFYCSLGVIIVFLCSLWYLSSGRMVYFNYYSNYYDMQADGFLAGQTSLLIEPPKELLNLADPYDWHTRVGIPVIWDASLFQGKYYVYWGPVPAIIAAAVKLFKPGVVQDQFLLLFFVSGLSVVFASLLLYVRKKFFTTLPAWTLTLFTLALGLSTPVFWLVNRPNVYETAIASCQFFLFLGLYALIRGMNAINPGSGWFLLAGFALGAAVGSRTSIVFTVIFVVFVALVLLIKNGLKQKAYWFDIMMLLIPLMLFAVGIAWFNFARFGSIFETGLRYQLTGDALPEDLGQLFSIRYIVPNLYLSLLQPFDFTPNSFPFIIANIDNNWTRIIHMPENYYFAEQVTGILCTIPLLWFLIMPIVQLIKKGWQWVKESPSQGRVTSNMPAPVWLWIFVGGCGFIAFMTNMMFIMTTMRYLADFSPLLILFVSLIVIREIDNVGNLKIWRGLLLITMVISVLATVIIALFINFMSGDRRMLNENPALYAKLEQFFNK